MTALRLPIEIINMIISRIPEDDNIVAVPVDHLTARTLYACLSICKATLRTTERTLYRHCLYIDAQWRLSALTRSYSPQSTFHPIEDIARVRRDASTALYLAPFPDDTIDNIEVVTGIEALFKVLAPHLRRLIIDMPLRSRYPDEEGSGTVRIPLRRAFLGLERVEEFVSVQDELYLSTLADFPPSEPHVWSLWPKLKRLALYNLDIDDEEIANLKAMPMLQHLVLTRPDQQWTEERHGLWLNLRHEGPRLTVVNTYEQHEELHRLTLDRTSAPGGGYSIGYLSVNANPPNSHAALKVCIIDIRGDLASHSSSVQEDHGLNIDTYEPARNSALEAESFTKEHALRGDLWYLGFGTPGD